MFTSQRKTAFPALTLALAALTGFCVGGCGDADEEKAPIDEGRAPLVVMVVRSRLTDRPDGAILADRILADETEGFFFDADRREALIAEIERALSAIRDAHPAMADIHAAEHFAPGSVWLTLEPELYDVVANLVKDREGPVRFETGALDFDALNAKLGLKEVDLGSAFSRHAIFYFDEGLNIKPASEAYSMLEGVRRAQPDIIPYNGPDIATLKAGETWHVVFRSAWRDCEAGCVHAEHFFFTATGPEVGPVDPAQADAMPPFRRILSTRPSWSHDSTPFVNAEAYAWSWGDSRIFERRSLASAGRRLGCSLFGEIRSTPNQIRFSCGYRITEALPSRAKHREGQTQIDGEPLDGFELTGVVLLAIATQQRVLPGREEGDSTVVASAPLRVAKTADEIENPEAVFFEGVPLRIEPPEPAAASERWWGGVHPTFIRCWDDPQTGRRAYQFIRPRILDTSSLRPDEFHPGCDRFKDSPFLQAIFVSWPLMEEHAEYMEFAPDPEHWTDWIDEILPRPRAPEAAD